MDQNTKMNVIGAGESTSSAWEEELDDVLSILGVHNNDTAHHSSFAMDNDVFIPDASDQQYPVLQSVFGEELHLFEDSGTPPIVPFCQFEQVNRQLHVSDVQSTSRPEMTSQSSCPVSPITQHMDSSEIASSALNANVTDNINQPAGITRDINFPYLMNRALFKREASPPENSFGLRRSTRKNQRKRQV